MQELHIKKSIPYISKKIVNDTLADRILRKLYRDTVNVDNTGGFHQELLTKINETLDTFKVLKGGAAVAAHMGNEHPELSDIDIELFVENNDFYNRIGLNNLSSFVPLPALKKEVHKIAIAYLDRLRKILKNFCVNKLIREITQNMTVASYDNKNKSSVIVFKSYQNEAVQFDATKVKLVINDKMPFKITMSEVNNEYYLVRYSFNLHLISKLPDAKCIRVFKETTVKDLQYFVFDLFFLDVSIKKAQPFFVYKKTTYIEKKLYNQPIVVESIENVIADQIECLMYNIFNHQTSKIYHRLNRLQRLISKLTQCDIDDRLVSLYNSLYYYHYFVSVREVKPIVFALGPALGTVFLLNKYKENKLLANIEDITHQINFPYHLWDDSYTIKCWHKFLCYLQKKFSINV